MTWGCIHRSVTEIGKKNVQAHASMSVVDHGIRVRVRSSDLVNTATKEFVDPVRGKEEMIRIHKCRKLWLPACRKKYQQEHIALFLFRFGVATIGIWGQHRARVRQETAAQSNAFMS